MGRSKSTGGKRSRVKKASVQSAPRPKRTLVLVVGMHRSGTSAMTRVMNLCGLTLPEGLLPPQPDNVRGFWEPRELVAANDRFLQALGASYQTITSLPDGFDATPEAEKLAEEIQSELLKVPGRKPVLVKDPRISRILPIWRNAAEAIGFSVKVVIMSRNPLEVAASLDARSGFSLDKSLQLWTLYNLDAERWSRGCPRVFVHYRGLLSDWRSEITRVSKTLRLPGLSVPEGEDGATVDEFLTPTLRHHEFNKDDLSSRDDLTPWVRSLYAGISAAAEGDAKAAQAAVDSVFEDTPAAIDVLGELIERKDVAEERWAARVAELEDRSEEQTRSAQAADNELASVASALAQARAENEDLHAESRTRQEGLNQLLRQQEHIDQSVRLLQGRLAEADQLSEESRQRAEAAQSLAETFSAQSEALAQRSEQLSQALVGSQKELFALQSALNAAETDVQAARQAAEEAAAARDEAVQALGSEQEAVREAVEALEAAQQSLDEATETKAEIARELKESRLQIDQQREQFEIERKEAETLARHQETTIAELKAVEAEQAAALEQQVIEYSEALDKLAADHAAALEREAEQGASRLEQQKAEQTLAHERQLAEQTRVWEEAKSNEITSLRRDHEAKEAIYEDRLRDAAEYAQSLEKSSKQTEIQLRGQTERQETAAKYSTELRQQLMHSETKRRVEVAELRGQLLKASERLRGAEEARDTATETLRGRSEQLTQSEERLEQIKDELHETKGLLLGADEARESSAAALRDKSEQLTQSEERVKQLEDELNETENLLLGMDEAREVLLENLEGALQEAETLREENAGHSSKIADLEDRLQAADMSLQRSADALRQQQDKTSTEDSVLKHDFDAEQLNRLEWERRAEWLAGQVQAQNSRSFSQSLMRSGRAGRSLALLSGVYSFRLLKHPRLLAKILRESEAIRHSDLFDTEYYLEQNWDVRVAGDDPAIHYVRYGAAEGRNPSPKFDSAFYLARYADVSDSGVNPLFHYIKFGKAEGRFKHPDDLPANADDVVDDRDPYSVRADEMVADEIKRGREFLSRFQLSSESPNFQSAADHLAAIERKLPVVPAEEEPDVSIIIPVYGQLEYTLNCLHALITHASDRRCEVLVVDDKSPDESARYLQNIEWLRVIQQEENTGFIGACNRGASEARGKYIVLLNNDTRVVEGWLDELVDTFDTFENAGLVGSKLFFDDGTLQEAGGIIWQDGSAWNYGRDQDPNQPQFCYARRIDYCSGASIGIPRELWEKIGGFDGNTFERAYCEDSDLAFAVRDEGYETWFQPLSRVVHYEGKTSGTDTGSGEKAYQVTNQQRLFQKWEAQISAHRPNGEKPYLEADRGPEKIALVIDATSPEPWRDAGSVTVLNTTLALQKLGYRVVFVAQDNLLYERKSAANLQRRGVEVLYLPFTKSIADYVSENKENIDLVHYFRYAVVNAVADEIRAIAPHAQTTFNVMDLHHLRLERQAELTGDTALRELANGEVFANETRAARQVDTVFVHTVPEYEALSKAEPSANISLYPYVVDEFGRDGGFDNRSDVFFLGGYGHSPNVDAVEFFVQEVMPRLRERVPGIRFHIAGSKINARIASLASDDVIIDGFVPKLRDYFARFRVMVAPLRYGAGIKGKVAAGLVHGVPSVVSGIAAEGMDLEDGNQAFVRDDPESIVDAIAQVYDDAEAWETMSQAALEFGHANYTLDAACRAFEAVLKDTAS